MNKINGKLENPWAIIVAIILSQGGFGYLYSPDSSNKMEESDKILKEVKYISDEVDDLKRAFNNYDITIEKKVNKYIIDLKDHTSKTCSR